MAAHVVLPQVWLAPAVPLLMVRYCGTTPNSTALGPLLKSLALTHAKTL